MSLRSRSVAEDGVWLTLEQGARYVGLNVRTFTRKVKNHEIPSDFDRARRRLVVHKRTLNFWVEQQRIKPGALWRLHQYNDRYMARAAEKRDPTRAVPSDSEPTDVLGK